MTNITKSKWFYKFFKSFYTDIDEDKKTIYYMDRPTWYWTVIIILFYFWLSLEIALGEFGDFLSYLIIVPIIFLLMLEWHNKKNPITQDEAKFNELQHMIFLHHKKKISWISNNHLNATEELLYIALKEKFSTSDTNYKVVQLERKLSLIITSCFMICASILFYSIIKLLPINI